MTSQKRLFRINKRREGTTQMLGLLHCESSVTQWCLLFTWAIVGVSTKPRFYRTTWPLLLGNLVYANSYPKEQEDTQRLSHQDVARFK
jgi:hypothetical protein